jgi:mRNA interferase HigB
LLYSYCLADDGEMRIISRKMIREFGKSEPAAVKPLDEWYLRSRHTDANNLVELQMTFPSADQVGTCTVFNVGGNKYRVIAKIVYRFQTVYLHSVLSHKEYDKDGWKPDCGK